MKLANLSHLIQQTVAMDDALKALTDMAIGAYAIPSSVITGSIISGTSQALFEDTARLSNTVPMMARLRAALRELDETERHVLGYLYGIDLPAKSIKVLGDHLYPFTPRRSRPATVRSCESVALWKLLLVHEIDREDIVRAVADQRRLDASRAAPPRSFVDDRPPRITAQASFVADSVDQIPRVGDSWIVEGDGPPTGGATRIEVSGIVKSVTKMPIGDGDLFRVHVEIIGNHSPERPTNLVHVDHLDVQVERR